MRDEIVAQLNDLNRAFYNVFADAFVRSRGASEPGLVRVLRNVRPGERVLDLGCGHGRVARMLPPGCRYVGVDFSQEMLLAARRTLRSLPHPLDSRLVVADLLSAHWPTTVGETFDWVLLRAVLHHIPGSEHRFRVVRQARSLLASGGWLVLANWQFLRLARIRRRLVPWERIGLTALEVEPGDYLLDWQRGGRGLRYVHLIDEAESRALAQAAGLLVASLFYADGHANNLTLYVVCASPSKDE